MDKQAQPMRIKVKISGHQYYSEVEGEVLYWCSSVEHYNNSPALQVPAVLLNTGRHVEVVTLQRQYYQIEVEVLPSVSSAGADGG